MKKTYNELNLKKIREEVDIDFAHFTYQRGQCSCCYGPKDLPKLYWKNRTIPDTYDYNENDNPDGYTYLLFKNADNGSGVVTRNDDIEDYTCVEWGFPIDKLTQVCEMLQNQLGNEYYVVKPQTHWHCIIIRHIPTAMPNLEYDIARLTEWLDENRNDTTQSENIELCESRLKEAKDILSEMKKLTA